MNIKEKLQLLINDFKGKEVTANDSTTLDELDFDSLDKVELLMKIENEFKITFDEELDVNTVGELIQLISKMTK